MLKKTSLAIAISLTALTSVSTFASTQEFDNDLENNGTYETEHQELGHDLHNNRGITVAHQTDGHSEVQDAAGNRSSYRLQSSGSTGASCPKGQAVCYQDVDDGADSVRVNYANGKSEIAKAESHSATELAEHAAQLGYNILSNTNGIVTAQNISTGNQVRVRYSAKLVRGATGLKPGIRVQKSGQIIERYTDGMEQEILSAP